MLGVLNFLPGIKRLSLNDVPMTLAAFIVGAPVIGAILIGIFAGGGDVWTHITQTFFWTYTANTLAIMVLMTILMLTSAVPTAWLVTMYDFPGRALFSWVLILPLAVPGYVLAFSYADFLGVVGPFQSGIRELTGLSARDYWFPDIRSLPGCAFVLSAALYPYVYLSARAGFQTQSLGALEAARSLGANARTRFWRIALPGARPAIAAGLALALMEAAADYGAAGFLGVQTLTVGVFRAWSSFGDPAAGARLAIVLIGICLFLQWLERHDRGAAGYQTNARRAHVIIRTSLKGTQALLATGFCALVFLLGFGLPVTNLIAQALDVRDQTPPIGSALWNSLRLAALGAGAAFCVALIIALGTHKKRPIAQLANLLTASGYAVPGAVLALGALYALVQFNLPLTGSAALGLLVWVYVCRFTTAGAQPMEAALKRAPESYDHAARSLGAGPMRRLLSIDLPIITPGASVGALILFVEILKELPATLMLRPFDWDTLAVRAYAYASDERLSAAALPSLAITLAGLLPVILLSWRLSHNASGRHQ